MKAVSFISFFAIFKSLLVAVPKRDETKVDFLVLALCSEIDDFFVAFELINLLFQDLKFSLFLADDDGVVYQIVSKPPVIPVSQLSSCFLLSLTSILRYVDLFLNENRFHMVLSKGGISEFSSLALEILDNMKYLQLYILIQDLTVTVFSNDLGLSIDYWRIKKK